MANARNLILGAAIGYSVDDLDPWRKSLNATGYEGEYMLFFDQMYSGYSPYCARFFVYRDLAKRSDAEFIMLSDTRDVIFQRDPFDFDKGELNLFIEDDRQAMWDCNWNSMWVERAYGSQGLYRIGHNPPSCSGTVIGSRRGILSYLDLMCGEMAEIKSEMQGIDQGIHNWLLYTGQLSGAKLFHNDRGPVLTMVKIMDRPFQIKDGQLLNQDGSVPNVIHQYDRFITDGRLELYDDFKFRFRNKEEQWQDFL